MAKPTPVLLMARQLGSGGSERQLAGIALSLDRSRFEPHVVCFRPEGVRSEELQRAGIPVVPLELLSFRSPSVFLAAVRLGRYVSRHRIPLVHTFDFPSNMFGVPVARLFRAPVVLSSQRAHRDLTPGLTRRLLRCTDRLADAVVVNCETLRRHLIDEEGVPSGRIRVCYNGVDMDQFRPLRVDRPEALKGASLVIGAVAVLRPEKGLHLLLEAFRTARSTLGGAKLVIVGDGPCLPELEASSRALGIREDCLFAGETVSVAEWMHAIDIFVQPSLSEALSNSLMEAMACGCAPVASDTGGNPELVRHGQTGMLFRSGDAGDLAAALSELAGKPELRGSLGRAASSFVSNNFSMAAAAHRMGEIYTEALARKNR